MYRRLLRRSVEPIAGEQSRTLEKCHACIAHGTSATTGENRSNAQGAWIEFVGDLGMQLVLRNGDACGGQLEPKAPPSNGC